MTTRESRDSRLNRSMNDPKILSDRSQKWKGLYTRNDFTLRNKTGQLMRQTVAQKLNDPEYLNRIHEKIKN